MISLNSVESAFDIFWNGSRDFEIEDVAFESRRQVEALEHSCRGKFCLLAGLQAIDVVGLLDGSEGKEMCHLGHVIRHPFSQATILGSCVKWWLGYPKMKVSFGGL